MTDSTARKIARMLKENTGEHMLDSGGAYGRHWQENQVRKFKKEMPFKIETWGGREIIYTKNVYHFLNDTLELSPEAKDLQKTYDRKFRKSDEGYFADMQEFGEYISEMGGGGMYGEGKPYTFNTYNGEDALSQTLQGLYFSLGKKEYVALQIHGGADVRGGYTKPQIFEVKDESFLMNADAYIPLDNGDSLESDDAGAHWRLNGSDEVEVLPISEKSETNPKEILVNGERRKVMYPDEKLQSFSQGGIVRRTGYAKVHKGELVIPASTVRKIEHTKPHYEKPSIVTWRDGQNNLRWKHRSRKGAIYAEGEPLAERKGQPGWFRQRRRHSRAAMKGARSRRRGY